MPDMVLDKISELVNAGAITAEQGQAMYMQSYGQAMTPGVQAGATPPTPAPPPFPPHNQPPTRPQAPAVMPPQAPGQGATPAQPGQSPPGAAPSSNIPQGYTPLPANALPVWHQKFPGQWVQDAQGNIGFTPTQGQFAGQFIGSGQPAMQAPQNIPQFFQQHMDAAKTFPPSGTSAQAPQDAATTTYVAQGEKPAKKGGADLVVSLANGMKPGKSEGGARIITTDMMTPPMREIFGEGHWNLDELPEDDGAALMRLLEVGQ